jgi:RHS repeat-associated protein
MVTPLCCIAKTLPVAQLSCGGRFGGTCFTGKESDSESQLDYFGARYYNFNLGRFMSPDFRESGDDLDPVPYADFNDPQSLNLYGYGRNNPLSRVDETGHYSCDPDTWNSTTNTLTAGACHLDFSDYVQFFRTMTRTDAKNIATGIVHDTLSYFDNTKNCPNCSIGIMPWGMTGGLSGGSILKIIEQDGNAIHAVIETSKGPIDVMANMTKEGDKLVCSMEYMLAKAKNCPQAKSNRPPASWIAKRVFRRSRYEEA